MNAMDDLLKKETEVVHEGLAWLAHHPELAPLGEIMGEYMANRALTGCLGEPWGRRCRRCLANVGVLQYANTHDALHALYGCSMRLAYQEALQNPVQAAHIALRSAQFMTDAMASLAKNAEAEHHRLAALLMGGGGGLREALQIYGGSSEWLHLGLPRIMHAIQHSRHALDHHAVTDLIRRTYDECRAWGLAHAPLVARARHAIGDEQLIYAPHHHHHHHAAAHHHHAAPTASQQHLVVVPAGATMPRG
jgi:hypothetical protein